MDIFKLLNLEQNFDLVFTEAHLNSLAKNGFCVYHTYRNSKRSQFKIKNDSDLLLKRLKSTVRSIRNNYDIQNSEFFISVCKQGLDSKILINREGYGFRQAPQLLGECVIEGTKHDVFFVAITNFKTLMIFQRERLVCV